ncbi:MAG TPA: proline dehydrogenase family protein, partial [Nitrospiria bacterium]|nr:proline dehydrogenase family protein [Nitrospiria bacterium]
MPSLRTEDIEKRTVEIGSEIIGKINAGKGSLAALFSGDAWSENLIALSLKNEKLKQGLFQFIDVLPSLKNDQEAVSHFTEYLGEFLEAFPSAVGKSLHLLGGKTLSPVSAGLIRSAIESLSGRFIIGKDFNDAASRIKKLNKSKRGVTLDLLGELTLCESEARAYQGRYLDLLSSISDFRNKTLLFLPPSISVKVSSLYSRLDPADWDNSVKTAAGMIRPIFEKAAALNIPVILDMESYYYRDLIVEIFLTLIHDPAFRKTPPAGIALQLYLKDGIASLQKIVSAAREIARPIDVRLVKGAYWDHEMALARQREWPVPVLEQKEETDAQYEEAARWLLEAGQPVKTVLGSHNIRSLSYTLAVNALLGKDPDNLEIQMLYGMAEPLQCALADMGYPVRVYAPVGELLPGMAYL